MPTFPMFYQNHSTANVTPTLREHKRQPYWRNSINTEGHQSRSRTITARGSSGDVFPHHGYPFNQQNNPVEYIHPNSGSASNLRRCLSLAESQNREFPGGSTAAPFSMEVIPETEMNSSSQNLDPAGFLRRDSTLEHIFAWQDGGLNAASMLSLNATPNLLDRSSTSDSRQISGVGAAVHAAADHQETGVFFETRHDSLALNYMARSGRDSGFIDIPSHATFAQMDSPAYSVIHSQQVSEPRTQEASDVKEITDAFEGLASQALNGSGLLAPMPPTPPPHPASTSYNPVANGAIDSWWATGFSPTHQQQSFSHHLQRINALNFYQSGQMLPSNSVEDNRLQAK